MQHTAPSVEDLYRSMGRMAMRFYGHTPGSHCVVASHALLACSGLGSVFLNVGVVFGAGSGDEDPTAARLREFVARIGARGVGGYVCLSEGVQAELEPLARELGLEPLPSIPLMSRLPGAAAKAGPSGAETGTTAPGGGRARSSQVERVTTELGRAEFLAVSEAAFALPGDLYGRVLTPRLLRDPAVAAYLLRLDGAAVACVCVVDDEGLVGISGMATLPELQGGGIGGRLLEHVLAEYRDGARTFFLTASEAGQRLYRRHGFAVVDAATAWVVSPAGT